MALSVAEAYGTPELCKLHLLSTGSGKESRFRDVLTDMRATVLELQTLAAAGGTATESTWLSGLRGLLEPWAATAASSKSGGSTQQLLLWLVL